jgi:hypothetical protein
MALSMAYRGKVIFFRGKLNAKDFGGRVSGHEVKEWRGLARGATEHAAEGFSGGGRPRRAAELASVRFQNPKSQLGPPGFEPGTKGL